MSTLEARLASLRARPPRWVAEADLPPLPPLSEAARRGFVADLRAEGPDTLAEHARTATVALSPTDCAALMRALLHQWALAGAPRADQRWLIFAVGLLGDEALLEDLGRRVGIEQAARRHQAARHCVDALLRNGGPVARRWLAHWARTAPGLPLRAAAWAACRALEPEPMAATASVLPPDLGFDADHGEQVFDHAGRPLRLQLTAEGDIRIREGDRLLRTLPAARRQDDPAAVHASRERFQQLRGQLQEQTTLLHGALEEAMILERPLADGAALLRAPLAYRASRGLIWEALDATGAAVGRFFVTDELEALDLRGEAFSLEAAAALRVVHPIRLSAEERAAWHALLTDAGALAPFPQLTRTLCPRMDGPAPLATALSALPPMSAARLARGLPRQGYLPDTAGGALWVERALKFLGPYLLVLSHEPFSLNPRQWDTRRTYRLAALEIRCGEREIPAERLALPVYSEMVRELRAL